MPKPETSARQDHFGYLSSTFELWVLAFREGGTRRMEEDDSVNVRSNLLYLDENFAKLLVCQKLDIEITHPFD
jgi:hypothetical protein